MLEIGTVGYNPDADLFARVEAATGNETWRIPDPIRAACAAASNGLQCIGRSKVAAVDTTGPGLIIGYGNAFAGWFVRW